jgi:polyisoprenoid-binding protein YceI
LPAPLGLNYCVLIASKTCLTHTPKENAVHSKFLPFVLITLFMSAVANAESYKVDPVHSSIVFKSKHIDTSYVFGRFNDFGGTVNVDSDPSKMSFDVTAKVDSIDTANAKRDTHLKSPDFFSAKEFPTIQFKSTSVKSAGDNKYEVTGDMTLHGVTKPITVTIEKVGASNNPQFGDRVGFITTFKVKRSDFGMSGMTNMIGDEVELAAAFETKKG